MSGLSLRQAFAAAALQGFCASNSAEGHENEIAKRYARMAVKAANALIGELHNIETDAGKWCSVCWDYHPEPLCDDDHAEPGEIRETGK